MKGWQFWLGSCLLLLFSAGRAGAQGLTVISPNGGESWLGASQQTITWSYVNVDNIKIEYSLNNGLSWNLLVSNYPTSALSYSWQVPALGSTQAKVRITSSLQFIQDESNAVFTIPEPSINLTYPNGGESCATGSMQYAEWNSSGIASVVLQYSQNDGQSWQDIGTFPAGNNYANWVAPASAGAVKLRAYNIENINKNDVSDGPVQVLAASPANPAKYSGSPYDGYDMSSSLPDALQLVSPNGGEVLNPYTDAPIKWTFTDVNRVNLFYSINNGSSWTAIATDVPADALQYSWSVPNTPSTNCRVKVVAADVALEDISNAKFTISDAFVQITYPNAGETFTAGTMQYIEWDYNAVATVKLEYSTDNGSSWNLIGTAPAGNKYANWVVPASATSGMLLRISDNAVPSLYDISDLSLPWQTANPANPAKYSGSPYDGYSMDDNIPDSIRISSPNGGEIWMSSSTKTITWTYNHVDNISLEYTLNDGQSWQSIVSNIPASQLSYNWVVPTTPSNLCRIRVKDILRPAITDISDNPFIIPTGAVQITYPNGGENYGTGTMQYIEWTSTGLETVKLEYSTDNGSSWNVIGTAPAANQYANWTAPLSSSDNCLVRVSDVGNQAVYSDQSNAVFRLFSSSPANPAKYSGSPFDGYSMYHFLDEYVKVIKPNGGEIWGNGTTHQIRWATLNNNENLKIEYSTDNEASWTTLLNDVPNTPVTYNWSIAALPSTICKVRASTMSGSEIDKSDDFFTIANTTGIITSAISGSEFCPGQTFPVSFFKTVNFNPDNRFIVQLSDSVGTFNGALENIGEVQSTSVVPISVTIPQRFYTSNLYRLRVIATDPPTIGTDNGSNFTIRPLPLAKLGDDITLCTGSSRQLDVTNQGASYLWSTGATTPSINVSQAGTYSVAVTNSCGTSRDTVKVKLLSPPSLELGPDKQICQNSVVVLEADSGASSYLWSTGATTRRINAVLAGKYVVYATNACGTSRDSVNVSYLQAQSLELGADRGLCPGSSITLNATTSNSTYLWSTGSTAPTITITQPGTYAVNVSTQCGLLSDQVTIFNGGINLSAGADVQLCRGGTATLQATGANSYTWNTGQTGSIIQVSPQNTTTYTVTATNIYNCTATDQVQVQVLPAPTTPQVTAQGNTTFCNGDSVTLQTPVQNGFTYQWLRNGLSVSGAESASYKVRSTANYQVRVSNAGKCEATSQGIQITVNLPDTLQRDTTACGFFSWQGGNYTSDTVLVSAPQNCLVTVWNVGIQPFVTQLRDTSACGRLVLNGIIYTSNAQEITDTIGCTRRGWNISIQPFIRDTTSASACGSYVWKGRTLSSTGFYADTVACAVSVLKLKINSATFSSLTQTAIGSYAWNGQTYSSSGTYSWTGSNASGCDSTATLILTILPESNPGPLQYQAIQEKLGACVNSPVKLSIKTLPRISTDSVKMNVNGDAATAYGNILNDGGKTITRRGFCWSTSANPTLSNSFSENGSGSGTFSGSLSALNPSTTYYLRAYAGTATEVWYGNEISFTTASGSVSSATCGTPNIHNPNLSYGSMTDQDGNSYKTIVIGTQEWMAENLKTGHYRNGDLIPIDTNDSGWTEPASCWFKNDSASYSCPYGRYYNWYAVADPRGLCPTGWHVPSDEDWKKLEQFLGMPESDLDKFRLEWFVSRGDSQNVGGKLQSNGSNESGFSAILGGFRSLGNQFLSGPDSNPFGFWWTALEFESDAACIRLITSDPPPFSGVIRMMKFGKTAGLSNRCVKDDSENGALHFEAPVNTGALYLGQEILNASTNIAYTGGNGGVYESQTINSTGVTGVTASLIAGQIGNGNGNLKFVINGNPSASGLAIFSLTIAGQTCIFSRIVLAHGSGLADADGNNYQSVIIGNQEWMSENIKVSRYRNGDPIPEISNDADWQSTSSGAFGYLDNNPVNNALTGKLYNWYAVSDSRQLCPAGWHEPSDTEWSTLENYLGGLRVAGGKMKTLGTSLWGYPNFAATNESGFSVIPGIQCDYSDGFSGNFPDYLLSCSAFWSLTENSSDNALYRYLKNNSADSARKSADKNSGFSVRCLKD